MEDGVTGLLVPPREPEALAEALIELLSDSPRAEAMGQAGYAKVLAELTWRGVAERMGPHIEAAVASPRLSLRASSWWRRATRSRRTPGRGSARTSCGRSSGRARSAGAVDGGSKALDRLEQAASFSPDRRRWSLRYHSRTSPASPLARRLRGKLAARRLRGLDADGLLQIGAWADIDGGPGLRCSYHDGNLAVSLARPEPLLDRSDRGVQRALAAERRLYDRTQLIFTMSDWLRRSFVDDFGQSPDKVVTVGAGANLESVPEAPERTFASPRILFGGMRWERKGGPQLLEAFRRVRRERADAELWIVGPEEAPATEAGRALLRPDPALARRASAGWPPSTGTRRCSRCRRSTSRSECLPGGDGLPAPVRGKQPLRDAGDHRGRRHRARVDAFDTGTLAERLLELAEPERARAFGEAGHRRFLERYTWDAVAARMVAAVPNACPSRIAREARSRRARSSAGVSSRPTSSTREVDEDAGGASQDPVRQRQVLGAEQQQDARHRRRGHQRARERHAERPQRESTTREQIQRWAGT